MWAHWLKNRINQVLQHIRTFLKPFRICSEDLLNGILLSVVSVEVPAAAVGHHPAGRSDPQHRSHRSGSLAVPGPPAEQWVRGTLVLWNFFVLRKNRTLHFRHVVSLSSSLNRMFWRECRPWKPKRTVNPNPGVTPHNLSRRTTVPCVWSRSITTRSAYNPTNTLIM